MRLRRALFLWALCSTPGFTQDVPHRHDPRPIDAVDSVFIEELTWMEVRDAIEGGKTTALVATGGIEQNGPYLVTGKHNVVLRATTEAIARKLGNVLVAPIIKLVPEGDFDPPTGHMRYPGTIGLSGETFKAVLRDVAKSLKTHGFQNIVMIGDSGGNQEGMKEVAEELTAAWKRGPKVHYIAEYYDWPSVQAFLAERGIHQKDEGIHDDYGITSVMMAVDPKTVRYEQRVSRDVASINGVDISPAEETIAIGEEVIDFMADRAVRAIQKRVRGGGASEP